ncbi:hypothetical protein OZ668_11605 [Elizabethkingia sp. HX XZB]|uniref:Lipoprotein n=1 Tax=Elizabethkingia miricola TaxID=172045 RepID=A0ABY3ND82_ELIMR|nr:MULTISPECIES: hypothetical protein [Elizabethkingia]MDX8568637.1 hypothetical protein [Elizabethkingia sp. HX XZB]TYO88732.1 hypothetical protein LX74_03273 [Elizabethkingia miricola]
MKTLIYFGTILLLFSCAARSAIMNTGIFESNNMNKLINEATLELYESKNIDSSFYILQNRDSLIILEASPININKALLYIEKTGCIKFAQKNFIVSKPYQAKYNILKTRIDIKPCDILTVPYNDNFEARAIKGIIYKITPSKTDYNFSKSFKGDVSFLFKNKEKYNYKIIRDNSTEPGYK